MVDVCVYLLFWSIVGVTLSQWGGSGGVGKLKIGSGGETRSRLGKGGVRWMDGWRPFYLYVY